MDNKQHSPLPWKRSAFVNLTPTVTDADNRRVCSVKKKDDETLIVKCVNENADLHATIAEQAAVIAQIIKMLDDETASLCSWAVSSAQDGDESSAAEFYRQRDIVSELYKKAIALAANQTGEA